MCAACPTPRLNQSYELRPPWEQQHLRYVPHRVRNGYNSVNMATLRYHYVMMLPALTALRNLQPTTAMPALSRTSGHCAIKAVLTSTVVSTTGKILHMWLTLCEVAKNLSLPP